MSRPEGPEIGIVAFADPETRTWGIAASQDGSDPGPVAVIAIDAEATGDELLFTPGAAAPVVTPDGGGITFGTVAPDATGSESAGGSEFQTSAGGDGHRTGSLPAIRATIPADAASARLLAAWLPAEHPILVAVLAARPPKAKGHDRDRVDVALDVRFDAGEPGVEIEQPTTVFDPRLSTMYDAAGAVRHAGVELWLGREADGDQRPFRLGAEPIAPAVSPVPGLTVAPMVARRAGVTGLGLYVLVTR